MKANRISAYIRACQSMKKAYSQERTRLTKELRVLQNAVNGLGPSPTKRKQKILWKIETLRLELSLLPKPQIDETSYRAAFYMSAFLKGRAAEACGVSKRKKNLKKPSDVLLDLFLKDLKDYFREPEHFSVFLESGIQSLTDKQAWFLLSSWFADQKSAPAQLFPNFRNSFAIWQKKVLDLKNRELLLKSERNQLTTELYFKGIDIAQLEK